MIIKSREMREQFIHAILIITIKWFETIKRKQNYLLELTLACVLSYFTVVHAILNRIIVIGNGVVVTVVCIDRRSSG